MLLRKNPSCIDLIAVLKADPIERVTLESALEDLVEQRSEIPERHLWKVLDLVEKQDNRYLDPQLGELLDAIKRNANWEIQSRHRGS